MVVSSVYAKNTKIERGEVGMYLLLPVQNTYEIIKKVRYIMNPMELLQLKSHFNTFKSNHPKFLQFINAIASKGLPEGSVIEITVKTPEGEEYNANMRVMQSDLQMIQKLKNLNHQSKTPQQADGVSSL